MDLNRHFRRLVFAQVLLGFAAFCLAEGSPGLLLVAGTLAALSRYIVEGPAGRPLPNWLILFGSVAAAAWLGIELAQGQVTLILAVGHFTIWLQVLQLYAYKVNRDFALLLVLSLLLMVGACVIGVSIFFGLLLVAYCVLTLFTVLVFQFKITADLVHDQNRAAAPVQAQAARPPVIVGRGHRAQFRWLTLVIGIVCAGCAAGVFLLFPRLGRPLVSGEILGLPLHAQIGYGDPIRLDTPPPVPEESQPLIYLTVRQEGVNLGERDRGAVWHLRGSTLDEYDPTGHVWSRAQPVAFSTGLPRKLPPGGLTLTTPADGLPPIAAEVTLCAYLSNTLFTLNPATYLDCPALESVMRNPEDQQLSVALMPAGVLRYTVRTPQHPMAQDFQVVEPPPAPDSDERPRDRPRQLFGPPFRPWPANEDFPDDGLPRMDSRRRSALNALRIWPVESPRIRELALSILHNAGLERAPQDMSDPPDGAIARALADYLRQDYTYSLAAPPPGPEPDPLLNFLFHHHQGHCELFASALTALARSVGLQARIATGFLAHDFNSLGGYYVIRSNDAHAWTEVWNKQDGWATVDATPPGSGDGPAAASGPLSFLSRLWEHLQYRWMASVISYDQGSRKSILAGLGADSDNRPNWIVRTALFLRNARREWRFDALTYGLMVCIVFFIGVALVSLIRLYLIRRKRLVALQLTRLPTGERRRLGRQLGFYLTLLDMLERHGHHRPAWQSPFAFAQGLVQEQPERFAPVVMLTEQFYEIRFGHRPLDPPRKDMIRAQLRRLEQTLGAKAAT